MRYAKDHKAATRERIVEAAARRFRRDGIDAVSVPTLMKEVGLTHGGFYAHFPSKEALVAEAIAAGMEQATAHLNGFVAPDMAHELRGFVEAYCSPEHRGRPETGCAIAALASETTRQPAVVRAEMASQIEAAIGRLETIAEPVDGLSREEMAAGTMAGVVGAIVLSRMSGADEALSDRILIASRKMLLHAARQDETASTRKTGQAGTASGVIASTAGPGRRTRKKIA